jgi:thiol-disulfide isomerase/thioredoxin
MRSIRFAIGGVICLALTQHLAARAESPEDVIRKMSDFYRKQKAFSVSSDVQIQIKVGDFKNNSKSGFSLVFERPNRLALRSKAAVGATVTSDGKTLYISIAALKKYSKSDAPKSLASLAENPTLSVGAAGTSNFAIDLLTDDPAALILKGVTASKDLGHAKTDGQSARHLKFTQGEASWEVWVADEKDPILLRAEYDLSKMLKKNPVTKGKEIKLTLSQTFSWKFGITPSPKEFAFTPPKNSKEVENVFGRGEQEEELPALLGKAAPPVDLERLDGKRLTLADHKDKDVVMLDMWATWCGPCRRELPHLVGVAKDYKSKGVVFYAINLRESKKKVEDFLKKEKLDMTVGLDTKGKVADSYGVSGIPMLLLIDKKGVVQSVHVGYSPGIEKELHKELDGVLAGKNLAATEIARFEARKKAADKAEAKQQKDKDKKSSTEQTAS